MKKLVTIALLCAMLLSCFAGCAMQKGEVYADAYAEEAAVQDVALTTPTTVPTENVSKWTGGKISAGTYDTKNVIGQVTGIEVSLNKDDYTKNTTNVSGASIAWFNPAETTHYLNSAADLVGFMTLRLFANDPTFKESYKTIANRDLNSFDAHTFVLKTNVDLNDVEMGVYNSAIRFEGTFDGDNHAIMNFNMNFSSGTKGFFSAIQGDACVKNLSMFDVTGYCISASGSAKSNVGSVIGNIVTTEGKTAKVSNVYSEANFTMDGAKASFSQVGGIIGTINGNGNAEIEDCVYGGTIDMQNDTYKTAGQYSAGVCRGITGTASVTFRRCATTADASITIYNTDAAGILAYCSSTGAIVIEDCVNNASLTSTQRAAGIIAYYKAAGKLTVTKCVNNGDLTAPSGYVGGMVGRAQNVVTLEISNCTTTAEATLTTGVNSAGIIGYIDGDSVESAKIENCSFEGVMSTGRGSGGIAGYPHGKNMAFTMTGCTVTGTLNLNAGDVSNNSLGGLIGRFDAKTATISGCTFNGTLNANFDPQYQDSKSNHCTAGGLIGYAFNASNTAGALELKLSNNKVSGTLNFTKENLDDVAPVEAEREDCAIYVAYVADSAKVEYGEGMVFDVENTTLSSTSAVALGDHAPVALKLVGKQYKDNEDGTHDLRIVLGADEDAFRTAGVVANVEALGIKASLYYKAEGAKVAKFENESFYVTKVYNSIKGGDQEYTAASQNCDYLYTLVVKNIPAELNVQNGNLEIDLAGFASMMVDGVEVIQAMDTYAYGEIVIEEPAA